MNLTKQFRVDPVSTLDRGATDPGFHGEHKSEAEANETLRNNLALMTRLQRELYAGGGHSILIVLQGKDGIC